MTIDSHGLKIFVARVLYIQVSGPEKYMTSFKIAEKINSQTANAVAICEGLIEQQRLFQKWKRASRNTRTQES
jgi:hypothetical protein